MTRFPRIPWRVLPALLLTLLAGTLLGGCVYMRGTYSQINHQRDYEGQPVSFKRAERHPERDFFHHWSRKAYVETRPALYCDLCEGHRSVLREHGPPDYIRKPFASFEDQVIEEWLYLGKAKVFQFHLGEVVWEGPLTDYELTLLRRGYPDDAIAIHTESAPKTDIFIYTGVFFPAIENFKFSDGYLVQAKEGE